MKPFAGFPVGKTRFTPIPDLFFGELLGQMNDLAELKLTLFMFWYLHQQRGYPRYMTIEELCGERTLLSALDACSPIDADPIEVLKEAVATAVGRGTLLQIEISASADDSTHYLFANTPLGRKAVAEVQRGELVLDSVGYVRQVEPSVERATVFELYEQSIGLLTPMIAEELREAEDEYPIEWFEDAFRIAAERNARNWRYVHAILKRWAQEGKDDGEAPRRRAGARHGTRVDR